MMAFGTAAFMANYFAFCQDVSARNTRVRRRGCSEAWGTCSWRSSLPFAGYVKVATGSFGPIFVLAGLLPFVGLGALVILGWGADPVENRSESEERFG